MSDSVSHDACCGAETYGECSKKALYCVNRSPKEIIHHKGGDVANDAHIYVQENGTILPPRRGDGETLKETVDRILAHTGGPTRTPPSLQDLAPLTAPVFVPTEKPIVLEQRFGGIRAPTTQAMLLRGDSQERKDTPIGTGVIDYFPRALAAVARLSKAGNDKHNPGQPLHWAKEKSTDHPDCIIRHFIDRGKLDPDSGELHDVGLAWRALANLELVLELLEKKTAAVIKGG